VKKDALKGVANDRSHHPWMTRMRPLVYRKRSVANSESLRGLNRVLNRVLNALDIEIG
jgi:hypothetical protein